MEIPGNVQTVLKALEAAGREAWCVGGCVRDALLGRTPEDWDVTTSARPEETLAIFGGRSVPTGLKHGTVTVRTEGGAVEVTTYRVDGKYRDHRRPDSVRFTASLEEDLARRDFTVNAMALNLRGELRDPFGGQEDLRRRMLRCVGEPDRRFQEDALRILRGMRFAAVLGFDESRETRESMDRSCELLREVAAERIQVELVKLLCGNWAGDALDRHPRVIGSFWPEILPMVGFDQRRGQGAGLQAGRPGGGAFLRPRRRQPGNGGANAPAAEISRRLPGAGRAPGGLARPGHSPDGQRRPPGFADLGRGGAAAAAGPEAGG